jgi:hypothetical protein
MEDAEFKELWSHIDYVEILMREKKPKEFIKQGKYDDAIACAIAEGIRMGWDAHKKKVEKEEE